MKRLLIIITIITISLISCKKEIFYNKTYTIEVTHSNNIKETVYYETGEYCHECSYLEYASFFISTKRRAAPVLTVENDFHKQIAWDVISYRIITVKEDSVDYKVNW